MIHSKALQWLFIKARPCWVPALVNKTPSGRAVGYWLAMPSSLVQRCTCLQTKAYSPLSSSSIMVLFVNPFLSHREMNRWATSKASDRAKVWPEPVLRMMRTRAGRKRRWMSFRSSFWLANSKINSTAFPEHHLTHPESYVYDDAASLYRFQSSIFHAPSP